MKTILFFALFGLLSVSHVNQVNAEQNLSTAAWQVSEKGVIIETVAGHQAFRLDAGELTAKDTLMQDGVIEFDMFSSGERAFFYVYFRQQSKQDSEVVYIRTHKSKAPDTIQYAPVFQGRSAWQIYHGKTGTASAYIPAEQWVHVKLKIHGQFVSIWVGDNVEPVVKNMPLSRTAKSGSITIRGNIPRQSAASYSAYVRNIHITPTTPAITEDTLPIYENTQLTQFSVSQVFAADKSAILNIPEAIIDKAWTTIPLQPDGKLEFLRWRSIPKGIRTWAVVADIQLNSEQAQACLLEVGFSDTLTLYLNNQALVYADASYRYSENRQEGLLHDKQLTVFLPLKKGANQLRAIVADSFGGWGLLASLSECTGITQNAPEEH